MPAKRTESNDIKSEKSITNAVRHRPRKGRNMAAVLPAYRAIVDGSVDLIAAVDRNYTYLHANNTYLEYHDLSEEHVIGHQAAEILGQEVFATMVKPFLDRALQGETIAYEMAVSYPKLGDRHMHITYYPLRNVEDVICGVASTIRDITERKQMEEQLAHQANVLNTVMANTGAMLVYFDREFNFVIANKAYIDSCGHTWEELKGENHFRFFPDAENEAVFRHVRDKGETISFHDKPFQYASQPWRGITYWDWTLVPIKDDSNQVVGLVLSLIETTIRKRAAEALRESEERFRKYFELGLVGMAVETPAGDWIEVNDRFPEIFGYSRDEFLSKHWIDLTHPEDLDNDLTQFRRLQRGEIDGYSMEKRYLCKDGAVITCMIAVSCYRDQKGELVEVYGLVADITDQKRSEEALAKAKEELEAKVKERTRELRQLARKLVHIQEQERALIGHELHDEVGQLLTYTTLLISRAEQKQDKETLSEAKSTVREAMAKIRNLSSLLSPGQLRSTGLLGAVESLCQEYARRTDIKVDFAHSDSLNEVPEDVALAGYRIVQEALTNILRHANASEVRVRLARCPGRFHVEVEDNGSGFNSGSTKKSRGLTGMRERALALGGQFSITSSRGLGIRVIADIPLPETDTIS